MRIRPAALAGLLLVASAVAGEEGVCPEVSDPAAVDRVRRWPAGELEAGLPDRPFGDWLDRVIGWSAVVCWELNDCGEQTGDPARDRGRDLPLCVEARARTAGGRLLVARLLVGSVESGASSGRPRLRAAWAVVDGKRRQVGSLAELAALGRARARPARNESPLAYQSFEGPWGEYQFCWRAEWPIVPLRGSALHTGDLRRGTSCVVADFDGNGYLDFALQGYGLPGIRPERKLRVIFYEGDEVVRTLDIPGGGFELYPARAEEGPFGEPASELDGLVIWGEGGTTAVWLWEPDTERLERTDHASEDA